ncbi:hypothetical protein MUP07_00670 [Candidatus Bathyarchaeota archaeon]|nr:hypothetical protein [Candidatus Bathyarchaeota archaeon]
MTEVAKPIHKCPMCDGRQDQPSWFLFKPEVTIESVCYNAESGNCLLCREPECNLSGMSFPTPETAGYGKNPSSEGDARNV